MAGFRLPLSVDVDLQQHASALQRLLDIPSSHNPSSDLTLAITGLQGRNKITKHVEREVICHSNFCHPHVIQFKEIFLTPTHLAIAMEYAPGGDMFQYVKRSSGLKVASTAQLSQLSYLEISPAPPSSQQGPCPARHGQLALKALARCRRIQSVAAGLSRIVTSLSKGCATGRKTMSTGSSNS